jgi:hypothetical protein
MILTCILVLIGSFVIDLLWVLAIRRVSQGKAIQSSFYSGMVSLITGLVTIGYISRNYLIIFYVLGASLGAYVAVRLDVKYERN